MTEIQTLICPREEFLLSFDGYKVAHETGFGSAGEYDQKTNDITIYLDVFVDYCLGECWSYHDIEKKHIEKITNEFERLITHEETHRLLKNFVSVEACHKLDNLEAYLW